VHVTQHVARAEQGKRQRSSRWNGIRPPAPPGDPKPEKNARGGLGTRPPPTDPRVGTKPQLPESSLGK
jgi:hypothetical protein